MFKKPPGDDVFLLILEDFLLDEDVLKKRTGRKL